MDKKSTTLSPSVGWRGELTAKVTGLYAGRKTTGTLTGTDQNDHFDSGPYTSDAIAKLHVHVPQNASFTRVAIRSADFLPDSDIDLYAFDTKGTLVSDPPGAGSDQRSELPPGDYDLYIVQYALPEGANSQHFTLWTWQVRPGTPDIRATLAPVTQRVGNDDRPRVTVSWSRAARY